jgi:uncharacterized OB-fold protein
MKKLISIILVIGVFTVIGVCYAQEEEITERIVTKKISGRLSSRSPINEPEIIGIVLLDERRKDSGHDMFFAADEDLQIVYKKSFGEIKIGDMVEIVYDEITQVTEEGEEKSIKRVAKIVKFLKSGRRR